MTASRYQVDPWSRGREVAGGVQRSSLKPEKNAYFLPSERDREFLPISTQQRPNCLCQMPGRGPPPITRRCVNTVTRGWVGALTGVPRSEFMAQSLFLSLDVCPGLGISPLRTNIWLSFCGLQSESRLLRRLCHAMPTGLVR